MANLGNREIGHWFDSLFVYADGYETRITQNGTKMPIQKEKEQRKAMTKRKFGH